jgi:hypothetical protein
LLRALAQPTRRHLPAAKVVLDALRGAGFDPTVNAPQAVMPNIGALRCARPGCHLVLNGHMDARPPTMSGRGGAARSSTAGSMAAVPAT